MFAGGLVCLFLAVYLFMSSLGGGGRSRETGAPVREVPQGAPAMIKVFFPVITAFSKLAAGIGWPAYRARAAVEISRSGWGDAFTVNHLLGAKFLFAIIIPLFLALLFSLFQNPAFFLVAALLSFYVPDRMLRSSRQAREREIVRTLPGAVDVLSLSVEAGLEFLIALERLVKRGLAGPLRDELTAVLNDRSEERRVGKGGELRGGPEQWM